MKKSSREPAKILFLIPVGILIALGFIALQLFCPECFASGEDSILSPLSAGEENSEENPGVARDFLGSGGPKVGEEAPDVRLKNLEGEKVALSQWRGEDLLLVFWGTHCGWCERERPDLDRFAREKKGKMRVLVIAPEPVRALKKYAREKEVSFILLSDYGGEFQRRYLPYGTPSHFLVDKAGKLAGTRPGYLSYQGILSLVEGLEQDE